MLSGLASYAERLNKLWNPPQCSHVSPFVSRYVTRKIRIYGRVNEVCWDTLRRAYLLSGMDCGGARGEELLWACVFLCAWQRTSCILPEQRRAHTPTSAVALTNLGLTWPSSPTSLLKSRPNWRNKRRMKWVPLVRTKRSMETLLCTYACTHLWTLS